MLRKLFTTAASGDGTTAGALIEKIIAQRPELASETFYVPGRGQMAITIMTSSEVFKAPRSHSIQYIFEEEINFMRCLSTLDIPLIPKLTYVDPNNNWFAMERKPGEVFDWGVIEKSGEKLGAFKAQLEEQTTGLDLIRALGDERLTKSIPRLIANDVTDLFATEPKVIETLRQYADKLTARQAVINHDDWNTGNMLFDPETKALTAVIDYGLSSYTIFPEREVIRMSDRVSRECYLRFVEGYVSAQNRIGTQDIAIYGLLNVLDLCMYDFREETRKTSKADFARAAAQWLESPLPSMRDKLYEKMRWG